MTRKEIIFAKLSEKFHLNPFSVLKIRSTVLLTHFLYSVIPDTSGE